VALRGVTLVVGMVVEDDSNYTGTCVMCDYDGGKRTGHVVRGSRLEGDAWNEETNWFPGFLRAFQRLNLQADSTRVVVVDRRAQRQKAGPGWHPKDRRWGQGAYRERREDEGVHEARRRELEACMRAVMLGQDISEMFPDREAEDEQLLEKIDR